MNQLFFELIQVSVGTKDALSRVPTQEEWKDIYDETNRQTLTGVMMEGLNHLPAEQRPPRQLLLDWHSTCEMIAAQNRQMNLDCVRLSRRWKQLGYDNIILKGQGNAQLYPNPLSRIPGDIDIWLKGERKQIVNYIRRFFPNEEVTWIEMNFPVLKGTPVEVHFKPTFLYNPWHNRRMCKYLDGEFDKATSLSLPDGEIMVPGLEMNLVFQLTHIYRHLFFEGIGLRQLVDYYYLLQQPEVDASRANIYRIVRACGLERFMRALMWVLGYTMRLPREKMLCSPDAKEGEFLLSEIMKSGNFGQSNANRLENWHEESRWTRLVWGMKWTFRLVRHYPNEVLWHTPYRMAQYVWRKWNNYL